MTVAAGKHLRQCSRRGHAHGGWSRHEIHRRPGRSRCCGLREQPRRSEWQRLCLLQHCGRLNWRRRPVSAGWRRHRCRCGWGPAATALAATCSSAPGAARGRAAVLSASTPARLVGATLAAWSLPALPPGRAGPVEVSRWQRVQLLQRRRAVSQCRLVPRMLVLAAGSGTGGASGHVALQSGAASGDAFGSVSVQAGTATGATSGNLELSIGSTDTGVGDSAPLHAGSTTAATGTGGSVTVNAGSESGATASEGGDVLVSARKSKVGTGGAISLQTGASSSAASGSFYVVTGDGGATAAGTSGSVKLSTGASWLVSPVTGTATGSASGSLQMSAGVASGGGDGGSVSGDGGRRDGGHWRGRPRAGGGGHGGVGGSGWRHGAGAVWRVVWRSGRVDGGASTFKTRGSLTGQGATSGVALLSTGTATGGGVGSTSLLVGGATDGSVGQW